MSPEPDGARYLAVAVIKCALDDLVKPPPGLSVTERATAIGLLEDRGGVLSAWCSVAGLEPGQVQREVQRRLSSAAHGPGGS